MDRDAALLAATFASAEREDVVEDVEVNVFSRGLLSDLKKSEISQHLQQVMDDDSDEADDIPTIKVGGEEFEITDVTHEIIARFGLEIFLLHALFVMQDDARGN